jgi:hypothetical protein
MKRWFPVFLAGFLMIPSLYGGTGEKFQAGLNFTLGFPQSGFKDNIDRLGYGGSGYFLYRLPQSPLYVGISAGALVYGSETWTEVFSPTFPEILVDIRTRNYILLTHLVVRLQPRGDFRPYIEGLVGLNYMWTETALYDADSWDDNDAARAVNFSDTSTSYGAGAGIHFTVLKAVRRSGKRAFSMQVELGARYLTAGRMEYLREGSIIRENGEIYYDVLESVVTLINLRAGISFCF